MMDKRKRVLLVERDNSVCQSIRNILKSNICDVDFTHDIRDTVQKFKIL